MDISRNNYESYFLDYLEGRLSDQEISVLLAFLEKNPDLEDELYQFENITLNDYGTELKNKEIMFKTTNDFKSVNEQNFPEFCIAHFEEQLGKEGEEMLRNYIDLNPSLIAEYNLYGKVYLEADKAIRYPGKSQLKQFAVTPARRWLLTASAVAAILIFALLLFPFRHGGLTDNSRVQTADVPVSNPGKSSTANSVEPLTLAKQTVRTVHTKVTRPKFIPSAVPAGNSGSAQSYSNREDILLASITPLEVHSLETNPGQMNSLPDLILNQGGSERSGNVTPEYQPLLGYALAEVKNKVYATIPERREDGKLSWWGIAEFGVKGINQLTGSNLRLERKTNSAGKEILALGAGKFEITAPLR